MSSFTKYNILPHILRHHVLSYSSHTTLSDYAPCSKLCNMEVQSFHTHVPDTITIHDWAFRAVDHSNELLDGVRVIMGYKQPIKMTYDITFLTVNANQHLIVFRYSKLGHGHYYDGSGYDAAIEYVTNRLKYARIGRCTTVDINLTRWPIGLMDIPLIKNSQLKVHIFKTTYQGFYESMNARTDIKNLKLVKCDVYPFTIPVQFFQTDFFQNLSFFRCDGQLPELPADCFLSMKATTIKLDKTVVTDTVVNQKLLQWFNNPPNTPLCLDLINGRAGVYRQEEVLRSLPVETIDDESTTILMIDLKHETGVKASIHLFTDCSYVTFGVDLETWAEWKRINSNDLVTDNVDDLYYIWDFIN